MICPYCGSPETEPYYSLERMVTLPFAARKEVAARGRLHPFEATLCRNCLLGFNSKRLSDEELSFMYDNYEFISPFSGIGAGKFKRILEIIQTHTEPGSQIVEVGCSEGFVMHLLRESGRTNISGIEPGPQALEGRERGLDIRQEYYTRDSFPEGELDAILMIHVFEHFTDPFTILDNVRSHLKPGGKFIIEVPNFWGYHHQHMFFYSKPFLQRLFCERGFAPVLLEEDGVILRAVALKTDSAETVQKVADEERQALVSQARKMKTFLRENIEKVSMLKDEESPLTWWGSGTTSLKYIYQLGEKDLEKVRVVDGDPHKWGKSIPCTNITVESYESIAGEHIPVMVIASEFFREIQQTMRKNRISADKTIIFND